jgi:hypothetical protein
MPETLVRDANTLKNAMVAFLDAQRKGLATADGEPVVDVLSAMSVELSKVYTVDEYLRRINSVAGFQGLLVDDVFKAELAVALDLSPDTLTMARTLGVPDDLPNDVEAWIYRDLNLFAITHGRPRKEAQAASGTIRLVVNSNNPVFFNAGIRIQTPADPPTVFETTADFTGVPAYDPGTNSLYCDAPMMCTTAGSSGNQKAGNIRVLNPTIPGIQRVFNPTDTAGGFPRETNEQLLERLAVDPENADLATRHGLQNFIKSQKTVQDSYLVYAPNPLLTRASAGAIDIYVIAYQEGVQNHSALPDADHRIYLPAQPVIRINAVSSGGVPLTATDFTYVPTTAATYGSTYGNAYLQITNEAYYAAGIDINYTVNQAIRDLQSTFDDVETSALPGGSIWVRMATQVNIDITMQVSPYTSLGLTDVQVQDTILQAVSDYLTVQGRASLVSVSDIDAAARDARTAAGARVISRTANLQIKKSTDTLWSIKDIQLGAIEYPRLGTLTINNVALGSLFALTQPVSGVTIVGTAGPYPLIPR